MRYRVTALSVQQRHVSGEEKYGFLFSVRSPSLQWNREEEPVLPYSWVAKTEARKALAALQFLLFVLAAISPAVAGEQNPSPPEQNHASWWGLETAMGEHGSLILSSKPWWSRALALKQGERFTVRSEHPGGGLMLVRRQRLVRQGKAYDAIVWVIDDDGDMRPDAADGDKKNDCYVVDYDGDGRADRMVDYLDIDGDGRADEMEIRYFQDGRLRRAWFAVDLDKDGRMMDLAAYEYSGNFFASDPYGNNMIYCNEYDPERNEWLPSCECPFAFYDTDGDGESEMVIRISAVPLEFNPRAKCDIDYGNSIFWSTAPFAERQRHPGVVNVRYSVDIDGLSSRERPLHYDMGFNMTGRLPYQFPGMERTNPLRRSPKATKVIPYDKLPQVADTYPAEQTGFSFREYGDDAVVLGTGPHAGEDRRWEGVFWTWNRRFMHNSGGPTQLWNIRREFCPTPSTKRELYYSRVDRRIHLKGASDGWICVGHLGNREPWGEIRMFDTNGDGYFDRWETHLHGQTGPARIAAVVDAGIRPLPSQWPKLQETYTREILPEALQSTKKLLAAMEHLDSLKMPDHLTRALAAASCDSERLYVLDIIRESRYLALREKLQRRSADLMASVPNEDLRARPKEMDASIRAWDFARVVSHLDAAYGEGRYDDVVRLLEEVATASCGICAPASRRVAPRAGLPPQNVRFRGPV